MLSSRSVASWVCFVGFLVFVIRLVYECIRDAHAKQVQREQWRREREELKKAQREQRERVRKERLRVCKHE